METILVHVHQTNADVIGLSLRRATNYFLVIVHKTVAYRHGRCGMPGVLRWAWLLSKQRGSYCMVSECLNPECRAAFLYLRQGRLFAIPDGQRLRVEFFWLCDRCATNFTINAAQDGSVRLVPLEFPTQKRSAVA